MKMGFILFDQMTSLDFVGFFEAVTWMGVLNAKENVSWHLCSTKEQVTDDRGMTIKVDQVNPDLSAFDMIFVPGGLSTRQLRNDPEFIAWIQTAATVEYKVSVCTGALILGAAGFLSGKKATTNPSAYDLLEPYCAEVVRTRFLRDGNIFTGGGVSASLDLGLYFIECVTNEQFAKEVQRRMVYPYYEGIKQE